MPLWKGVDKLHDVCLFPFSDPPPRIHTLNFPVRGWSLIGLLWKVVECSRLLFFMAVVCIEILRFRGGIVWVGMELWGMVVLV